MNTESNINTWAVPPRTASANVTDSTGSSASANPVNPSAKTAAPERKLNLLFPFMAVGSLIYAFFYTLFLYQNHRGITYPFFVGGTCLFFFCYLKKCGLTAGRDTRFVTVNMLLLGLSTCMTNSWSIILLNKAGIFCLFFYLVLNTLYNTEHWDLGTWFKNIVNTIFSSLEFIPYPFMDLSTYCKERNAGKKKTEGKGKYIVYGLFISLPLMGITLALLTSADAVFHDFLNRLFTLELDLYFMDDAVKITGLFLCVFFSSYCLLNRFDKHNLKENVIDRRTHEPLVAITFTGSLSFIYALFCLIQIVYLFGGMGTLPEGYSYSSYAREGFFQLVFICMLNLILVLVCNKFFRPNRLLKIMLTFICGCTYIMIASSAYRMLLYIQEYHLTFLRIFVLWALLVIALLIAGAVVIIYKESFPLVRYYVTVVTLLYLIFSFAHPDYWIAKYNLARVYPLQAGSSVSDNYYDTSEWHEFYYITTLSLDAAPAIADKLQEMEENAIGSPQWLLTMQAWYRDYYIAIVEDSVVRPDYATIARHPLPESQPLREFNFSTWAAYRSLEEYYRTHPSFLLETDA